MSIKQESATSYTHSNPKPTHNCALPEVPARAAKGSIGRGGPAREVAGKQKEILKRLTKKGDVIGELREKRRGARLPGGVEGEFGDVGLGGKTGSALEDREEENRGQSSHLVETSVRKRRFWGTEKVGKKGRDLERQLGESMNVGGS